MGIEQPRSYLKFIPFSEIQRVRKQIADPYLSCEILADLFRINTLYMITQAGSGHIGSSFSSMDIITWLWTQQMITPNQPGLPYSDTYFSSKGHDVPGLYALLIGLGKLDFSYIHKLRRLGGLPGHPDIHTPFIATNTGSLGMGVSKAIGMAEANRLQNKQGNFYILLGDGELQEGQIWESLRYAANRSLSEIIAIIDHNKMQSDTWVDKVSNLGNLEQKLSSFDWYVDRCNGHSFKELEGAFNSFCSITDRPKILIADTIKGKGVSFMQSSSFARDIDFYPFHSGALNREDYKKAVDELFLKTNNSLVRSQTYQLTFSLSEKTKQPTFIKPERLVTAYADELIKVANCNNALVVLDADLVKDHNLDRFRKVYPDRFIECGISEQNMVSIAGGLALRGFVPITHTFAAFYSRALEQVYNNASEGTKIIYVATLSGLLPASPGHTHQALMDITSLGNIPRMILVEPANEQETRLALNWAINKNTENTYLRIDSITQDLNFSLPKDYQLEIGKGIRILTGEDAALITYGPVMLNQGVKTSLELKKQNISLAVINLPWLNRIDAAWLTKELASFSYVFTIDNHFSLFGQGRLISSFINNHLDSKPKIVSFGIEHIPACGQNQEVLKHHGLDYLSLAKMVKAFL